jgi:opacity protein-like surface antigen
MTNPLFKFRTFFCSLLAISSALLATQGSCSELTQETSPRCFSQPLFEVKTGYFFFSNATMRKVYDRGGLDSQLCASYPLWNLASRWKLNAYGDIEYFYRSGKSINGHQKTSLWSIPVNIGLKPVYAINDNTQYYFSVGPRYLYIKQHNHSPYVYKNKSSNSLGLFVNTGFNYVLWNHFVIDIFGEYSCAKTHFHGGKPHVYTKAIQIGGFTFGGGLGYKF